jgi:hypothetical protein
MRKAFGWKRSRISMLEVEAVHQSCVHKRCIKKKQSLYRHEIKTKEEGIVKSKGKENGCKWRNKQTRQTAVGGTPVKTQHSDTRQAMYRFTEKGRKQHRVS